MISLTCDPRGKPAWLDRLGDSHRMGIYVWCLRETDHQSADLGGWDLTCGHCVARSSVPVWERPRHSRAGDTGVCSVCPGLTVVLVKLGPAVLMVSGSRVWGLSRDHRLHSLPLSQTNKVYWMLERAHSPGGQLWFQCLLCLRLVEFPRLALKRNCRLSVLYSES